MAAGFRPGKNFLLRVEEVPRPAASPPSPPGREGGGSCFSSSCPKLSAVRSSGRAWHHGLTYSDSDSSRGSTHTPGNPLPARCGAHGLHLPPGQTWLLVCIGSRPAAAPAASGAATACCFGCSQILPWRPPGKSKRRPASRSSNLNTGRLRLWFGNIYGDLLSALAAVQQQSGSSCAGQRPRQEETAIRTSKPSLICFHFTTSVRNIQLFSSSFL